MTLANKITVGRIITVPLFVIALVEGATSMAQTLFVLCVASDALDGAIARFRGERTALGSFLDPMADKLLLVASFIAFTAMKQIPLWVFIVVLSRDLLVVLGWAVVYILTQNAKVEPRPLGKLTTALQMAVAVLLLFDAPIALYKWTLHTMIAVTIVSTLEYIWMGNRRLSSLE